MSTTPIFDQLCQELGDVIEPEVSAQAINIGVDAVPEPAANPEEKETVAEWSAPKEFWDMVPRFDELPVDRHEH